MTALRTAAQQALEALERLQNAIYNIGGEHVTGLGGANDAADSAEKPMDALKAALAEPVQDWDELEALRESLREHMAEIHRLRAALADHSGDANEIDQEIEAAMADQVTYGLGIMLDGKRINPASIYKQAESANCQESRQAEPEQEPVAWMWEETAPRSSTGIGGIDRKLLFCRPADEPWKRNITPLYTAPPQRKPLTDGEIYTAYITATNQTLRPQDERLALAFARAIERAHGIGDA